MPKKSWEIKSKNYFARVKIKKTQKDGEYYDIIFGLKGEKGNKHLHFGIRVETDNCSIGGKVFFAETRQLISRHIEETHNQQTGEIISKSEIPYRQDGGKIGAQLHYGVRYDEKQKKAFLTELKIVEFDII